MLNLWLAPAMLGLLMTGPAHMQRATSAVRLAVADTAENAALPTENGWTYSVRESDAAAAVRRKAEFRAQQRSLRVANNRWYGMSKSRPAVASTPWGGVRRPAWVYHTGPRYVWRDSTWPIYFVRADGSLGR